MSLTRLNRYRPTRTSDAEGGYTEALGTAQTFFGAVVVHESGVRLTCRRGASVALEDVIEAESATYRVVGWTGPLRAMHREAILERIDMPVVP